MSLNKVMLIGRLGKDPELSYMQSGTARCKFSMATSEVYLDRSNVKQEKTEWHNVVVWGKQAESAGKYLRKGREVYVEGQIETHSWDDEKTGQKKYMTEIKAQRVVFLGSKSDGQGSKNGNRDGGGYQGGGSGSDSAGHSGGGGGNQGNDHPPSTPQGTGPDDDDIPF